MTVCLPNTGTCRWFYVVLHPPELVSSIIGCLECWGPTIESRLRQFGRRWWLSTTNLGWHGRWQKLCLGFLQDHNNVEGWPVIQLFWFPTWLEGWIFLFVQLHLTGLSTGWAEVTQAPPKHARSPQCLKVTHRFMLRRSVLERKRVSKRSPCWHHAT